LTLSLPEDATPVIQRFVNMLTQYGQLISSPSVTKMKYKQTQSFSAPFCQIKPKYSVTTYITKTKLRMQQYCRPIVLTKPADIQALVWITIDISRED